MIIQDAIGNKIYIAEDDSPEGFAGRRRIEAMGEANAVYMEHYDVAGLEKFFYTLPTEETEVMVCMYLGLKPKEAAAALGYRSMSSFYSMSARLRQSYQAKKSRFLGYD